MARPKQAENTQGFRTVGQLPTLPSEKKEALRPGWLKEAALRQTALRQQLKAKMEQAS